ncbi:PREDICTED: pro-cathepsin H-like [Amphimedon queenslandica]|uniref:Uncharacterized protein n=2 Tax=Amphimedon queenslandica TaxID=400682 RepID=A0AAN0IGU3_AMPQE|nr:PREDICTED: pro-cathepsin H-like [Amphimedon queenslandica]|eukprot:XP_003388868.1 PREDICTED: pro-cathepsin H-like [Amphimedon queenslandica]
MALLSKGFALFFLLASFTVALPFSPSDDEVMAESFNMWMKKYEKTYSTMEEYNERLRVYTSNYYYIEQLNKEHGPHTEYELNQFSDLTFAEFKKIYLTEPQHCSATNGNFQKPVNARDPVAVDWREKNVITPVKDQGKCGSCWTFSTTGCLEAHHAIKTGQLISLSEQQLVDCAGAFNNHGCNGGLPSQAFEYIKYNGGIESESNYNYTAKDGVCRFNSSLVAATVSDVVNITKDAEGDIGTAVANVGPVSIAFEVTKSFQHYKKGVYQGEIEVCSQSPDKVNHAVLVVGYNQTKLGEEYWIVKNSWSASWGMDGYFWIRRGHNACGLATCASYPIV